MFTFFGGLIIIEGFLSLFFDFLGVENPLKIAHSEQKTIIILFKVFTISMSIFEVVANIFILDIL